MKYFFTRIMLVIAITSCNNRESQEQLKAKSDIGQYSYDESKADIDIANEIQKLYHSKPGQKEINFPEGYRVTEFLKAKKQKANFRTTETVDWVERGPSNIGGRTRHLLVDASDPSGNTWFAGAAGGGVWKTTNSGQSWENKTINVPNLAVVTIAQSVANPGILYAGTGEGALGGSNGNGSGILKSTDGGESWELLNSTVPSNSDKFWNTNEIIVSPEDENYVLAATSNGKFGQSFQSDIMKSTDGGLTWESIYSPPSRAQQIIADPEDFNTLYVSILLNGIAKSTDGGETWTITPLREVASAFTPFRTELAIAPSNPNYLYASIGYQGRSGSGLYFSSDKGETWRMVEDTERGIEDEDYLVQGDYNNCITVDPYNHLHVFWGGVTLWDAIILEGDIRIGERSFQGVNNTAPFLDFVNFGAGFAGGTLSIPRGSDTPNLAIYFGTGRTQMAHRFTVPSGATSNVPSDQYSYQDFVEVPFEVWDLDKNRQLVVSFRDQENDGFFNLNERDNFEQAQNREYLYIHDLVYNNAIPDSNVTVNGGHEYQNLVFMWPTLSAGQSWDANNLPESSFLIQFGQSEFQNGRISQLTRNTFASFNEVHVDHHYLTTIPRSNSVGFRLITTNDGGVAYSDNGGINYNETDNTGYNTTQFYNAIKEPGSSRYLGGTQDNDNPLSNLQNSQASTFFSDPHPNTLADGFENVWHFDNTALILSTHQRNVILKSKDGGDSWERADEENGLEDAGFSNEAAPFYTKLGNSYNLPDLVFAVSDRGIWRSGDFGENWQLIIADYSKWGGALDVEVSDVDPNVVWAGGAMFTAGTNDFRLYVSTNAGRSFLPVNNFASRPELGNITSIVPDPNDANTCYVLFSQYQGPKILKTTDLGQNWTELSGYGNGNESTNGFPEVGTYSLLVFPNGQKMWAGTDIGLFETIDGGQNWYYADNGLPSVMVADMKVTDGQVVVATHGRGIWTADLGLFYVNQQEVTAIEDELAGYNVAIYPNPVKDKIFIDLPSELLKDKVTYIVFDLAGKEVLSGNLPRSSKNEISIPSSVEPGLHILRLEVNGSVLSKRFLKQ